MKYLIESVRIEYGKDIADEVSSVTKVVRSKIVAKNLFGWRAFIEDVLIDLVAYMIKTEFKYSGGAYVACGMQAAIDAARYCSAQKRRGDYETISIHSVEKFLKAEQSSGYAEKVEELIKDIERLLDEETTESIREFLEGRTSKLSKEVIAKCKTPEFVEWLRNYRD